MKKLSIIMALFAVVLGFTGCSEDKDPVYQQPTKFVLNTPALATQYYELAPKGTLVFTVSQPDYGFVASTSYAIQIALTEEQKADPYTIVPDVPTSAVIRVKAEDVALGMCQLMGIQSEDDWNDPEACPVYVRATSQLGSHENSFIASNWVTLEKVKTYFAVPVPAYIYLVGNPEGWKGPDAANADHYADWRLFEKSDAIGSNIYYGTFELPAAPMFRFYTALTGWDGGDSVGYQADDSATDFDLDADGTLTESLVKPGKGSFNFPNFPGGMMTIIVDMNSMKVTFMAGEE